jgi:ATPase family associated with various cellular activities (AAA)
MSVAAQPYAHHLEHLQDELRRLDLLIRLRAATLPRYGDPRADSQLTRTAVITGEEVDWLLGLTHEPIGTPDTAPDHPALVALSAEIAERVDRTRQAGVVLPLPRLGQFFGLSSWELQAIVICLAPELRRRYDRLYAYLQDDITRKRPSVDLVLDLLCDSEIERWQAQRLLAEGSSLIRAGLLETLDDPYSPSGSTGLARFLRLDPQIRGFVLGDNRVDPRLGTRARIEPVPDPATEPHLDPAVIRAVAELIKSHLSPGQDQRRPLVVHLSGPTGSGKRELAVRACSQLPIPVLSADVAGLAQAPAPAELVRLVFRDGLLLQSAVYLRHAELLAGPGGGELRAALDSAIADFGWLVFLGGDSAEMAEAGLGGALVASVELPTPDVLVRMAVWQQHLARRDLGPPDWAEPLAARFQLTPGRIRAAADMADADRMMRPSGASLTLEDLMAACRRQSRHRLGELAVKIEQARGWDDLVLPDAAVDQLHELCNQIRFQHQVHDTWGFRRALGQGSGVTALFSGPPGTGKTMAAEVIAGDAGLDLYAVDLSTVVSKYIGETEKNLARIFREAQASNAILLFDEADALFGKRTQVTDAHDRYANIETSYLLQRLDAYTGTVILATNMRQNLDDAFTRRLRFLVDFTFPDEAHRLRIWRALVPPQAPLSPDVDFAALAREFPLAGGNIKNVVLNAAFLAAADDGTIGLRHLLHGTRREFDKVGKVWTRSDNGVTARGR